MGYLFMALCALCYKPNFTSNFKQCNIKMLYFIQHNVPINVYCQLKLKLNTANLKPNEMCDKIILYSKDIRHKIKYFSKEILN